MYRASFALYYASVDFIIHIAMFVVIWLVFCTSESHNINKSLETVRKSSMDSM